MNTMTYAQRIHSTTNNDLLNRYFPDHQTTKTQSIIDHAIRQALDEQKNRDVERKVRKASHKRRNLIPFYYEQEVRDALFCYHDQGYFWISRHKIRMYVLKHKTDNLTNSDFRNKLNDCLDFCVTEGRILQRGNSFSLQK